MGACAAVCAGCVMGACDRVRSIFFLPRMVGCHSCLLRWGGQGVGVLGQWVT